MSMRRDTLILVSEVCRRLADKEKENETTEVAIPGEDGVAKARQKISQGFQDLLTALGPSIPFRTVEVKFGDTLWGLSTKHLGNGQHWREVYLMNIDKIASWQEIHNQSPTPDMIYPGQTVRLLNL
jgi:nucleoid-associated protein YgaU